MFLRKRLTLKKNQLEEENKAQEARILINDDQTAGDNAFSGPLENAASFSDEYNDSPIQPVVSEINRTTE